MKLFNFRGSHFDVGLAMGKTFGRQIRKTLASNVSLEDTFLRYHRTAEGKRKYRRLIRLHRLRFPEYLSELEGISQGAGVSFEELFMVNMRGEYEIYATRSPNFECSTCSLLTDNNAIFAHNEDGSSIYHDQMYLVRLEIEGKPALTAFCYPGFLPGNAFGFNSEGICFSANSVLPKVVVIGVGRQFIVRSLFESTSLEQAIRLATTFGRASGFNYAIGSLKERRMVDLEVSPMSHHLVEIKGCFFHANHYIGLKGVDQSITPSSRTRQHRGLMLVAKGVAKNKTGVLKILRDRGAKDYPILRDGTPPDGSMTLVTALFDLDSKTLTIYPGGAGRARRRLDPLIEISMTQ
jgi:predicted choloylglycine hydrolase